MKKTVCLLCVLLISALFISPLALATDTASLYYDATLPRVIDEAGLLTTEEENTLSERIKSLTAEYNVDLVILTNNSLNGKTPMAFADDYYDYNGYGVGEARDGMLFLLSMGERDYRTSTTGKCIDYFSDADIASLGDAILSDLKSGNYYDAFTTYVDSVESELNYEINVAGLLSDNGNEKLTPETILTLLGYSFSSAASKLLGCLIVAVIVAVIVAFSMRSKMKPVKLQNYAGEYIEKDSFTLTNQSDIYLFSTTARKRVPKQTSSGGGGGGSSTHVGSSGTSHGGGGGKF